MAWGCELVKVRLTRRRVTKDLTLIDDGKVHENFHIE